jgi:predicted alpha/beta superfamily hydrolase
MNNQRRIAAVYFFALSIIGLVTAWYFNFLAVLGKEDYLRDGFTSNVDWVYSLDLLIGGFAGMTLIILEGRRLGMKNLWLYIVAAFGTAFAFVFPLFLAMRELKLQKIELAGGKIKRYTFDDHPVIVWVPADVDATTPVLVMNDGHNMFDPKTSTFGATWGLLDALRDRPVGGSRIRGDRKPLIIGVTYKDGNGQIRQTEYGPTDIWNANPRLLAGLPKEWQFFGPDGNFYHELIAKKILPTIAAEFGVKLDRDRTAIGGSSMGALTSLYALSKYPDIYGTALAYSTHWPIGGEKLGRKMIDEYIKILPKPGKHRIWSDGGTIELDALYAPLQEYFRKQMAKKGYREGVDYIEAQYPNTGHSELWWAGRVEHPINWWLDPNEPKSTFENMTWVGKAQK